MLNNDRFMTTFVKKVLTMLGIPEQIAIASDHAGYALKEYIKSQMGGEDVVFHDFGTFSEASMDYPDPVHPLARAILAGEFKCGIVICGSGNGVAIVTNKYAGIRAALCWTSEIASLARRHNDANVLALPARFVTPDEGLRMVKVFLSTGFEGGRHQLRVDKIDPNNVHP